MNKIENNRILGSFGFFALALALMIMFLIGISNFAFAFEIPLGNEDIKSRWDNTFRYNYGVRLLSPAKSLIQNPNYDDGDRNFSKGTVTNRLDILSEFDVSYKEKYGIRVSGAFWYDQAYHDSLGNDSLLTSNHLDDHGRQSLGLNDYTKRLNAGPSGELLDAFVFGRFDLGPVPLQLRVGRHTLYWGEALLFGGAVNGISYSQFPIDFQKGLATPGADVKELFRPLAAVSASAQLTPEFSIAGQYFLQWESYRYAEAGSFLSTCDLYLNGSDSMILAPGVLLNHGRDQSPTGRKDFGVAAYWAPFWLAGKLGLFYRNFTDKQPQLHLDFARSEFFFAYPDNIDLFGVSFSKQILGISVGAEYNYRHNMPLVSSAAIVTGQRPDDGETLAARGNTHHALINLMGILGKTPLWDSALWMTEINYIRLDRVTQGDQYFSGRDGYEGLDRATSDAWGGSISFTPTWFAVFPGMDLSAPINFSIGLGGTSVVLSGDNRGAGSGSVGLSLDVYAKYKFDLAYNCYYGDLDYDSTGTAINQRGSQGLIKDRDWLSFTFKTTF